MPHINDYVFYQLLVPALVLFFFIGGLFALAVGVGLIVSSSRVFRLFAWMNHMVSTRQALKPMTVWRDSTSHVWKYRRRIGAILVAGAAYSVYELIVGIHDAAVVSVLKLKLPPPFVLWLVQSTRWFLIAGCSVSIAVGILLVFFPEAMLAIEKRASHWISARRLDPGAEKVNLTLDNWVAAFPRAAGWILVFPALVMVIYFGSRLLGRI